MLKTPFRQNRNIARILTSYDERCLIFFRNIGGIMRWEIILMCLLGGYLWGSISIARIVTRFVAPDKNLDQIELKNQQSGETQKLKTVGATTASVVLGPKYGGMIGILDIFKGAIPALILRLIFPEQPYFLFLGTAIVIGHIFPLYFGFKGGGGLSPALGTLLVLDPLGVILCILVAFVVGMFVMKNIAFAIMGGPVLFVIWIAVRTGNWIYIIFSILINLLLVVAVIPDVSVYLKSKKSGNADLSSSLETIPMGQMMNKMMRRMGIDPDKKT
jgi:glycerol-3-phosphate acyltransferase PlsY